jgi:hypothetical protein
MTGIRDVSTATLATIIRLLSARKVPLIGKAQRAREKHGCGSSSRRSKEQNYVAVGTLAEWRDDGMDPNVIAYLGKVAQYAKGSA